jgi:hypothetical protein
MWTRQHLFYLLAAAVIFLILQAYFVLTWDSLYAPYPWRGYAPGVAPPFFASSPRSEPIGYAVLFATAFVLTLIPSGRRPGIGAAMWAGVMAAIVLIWVATPRMRDDSNMWPISLAFLAFMTGVPMLFGRVAGVLYWRVRIGQKIDPWLIGAACAALAIVAWVYRGSL